MDFSFFLFLKDNCLIIQIFLAAYLYVQLLLNVITKKNPNNTDLELNNILTNDMSTEKLLRYI